MATDGTSHAFRTAPQALTGGVTYYILLGSYGNTVGSGTLRISQV